MTKVGLEITCVRFIAAADRDRKAGILGWVSLVVNAALVVDGIALRRTLNGRLALSFPARRSQSGRRHYFVRPMSEQVRLYLESKVFEALNIEVAS